MYGAILGDIIGSPYEWHNKKSKDFPLFSRYSRFTDDTVMTLAVAEGFMSVFSNTDDQICDGDDVNDDNKAVIEKSIIRSMKTLGLRYPNAGYGGRFRDWLENGTGPYGSWGNGSAMRVSSAAWICSSIDKVRELAGLQAAVTHDHPEGIKGAEALASAIFIARAGGTKEDIRAYVTGEFGYDLSGTCDSIRPGYSFDVSCQGSVPEAIIAFLGSRDFEDTVRNAISLGGDSDTIGAMAGSIAEAFYGVPAELKKKCESILPPDLREILKDFAKAYLPDDLPPLKGKVAEKGDWKTTEMPEEQENFILHRRFNDRQMAALRRGHIPQEMEDKWFWYMEGDTLFAHRSWTGSCIYRIDFRPDADHLVIVNRDTEQYSCESIEEDARRINDLLSWWSQATYDYYGEWLAETVDMLEKHSGSPLSGKTILFLGSSVTYGSAAEGQSFVELFETLDGVNAIKEAKSGTTLVDEGDSYIKRLKKVDTAAHIDCVLCQLSTNDASLKLPLGETGEGTDPEPFDTSTVTGAMEFIIAYSRKTWGCPVVFYTGAYYDSKEYSAMVERLSELRDKWGIGVIDLYTDKEFNDIDEDRYNLYMADAVHPTKAGYAEWWMPKMESEMIHILST